jgi:histone H3/H4
MNHKEILKNIKELVGLAKQESAKEVDVVEEVVLSTEETVEKVVEEVIEEVVLSTEEVVEEVSEEAVELAEEAKEEPKEEAAPIAVGFATQEELSQVKQELLAMIKTLIEEKSSVNEADVPAQLSAQEPEAVELSEEVVEEIVHSPESVTEQKKSVLNNNKPMTTAERVAWMINN